MYTLQLDIPSIRLLMLLLLQQVEGINEDKSKVYTFALFAPKETSRARSQQ